MAELEMIPINIGNVNGGAMIEGFDIELRKALENIADINTPATASREVVLKLTLKPHSDRVVIDTEFRCSSKLSPIETHCDKVFMGHTEGGTPVAFLSDPRQMPLWSTPPKKDPLSVSFDGTQK